MTTEAVDTQEVEPQEVHNAVVVSGPAFTPIKFNVSTAAVADMYKHALTLMIAGPEDKDGYKAVYEYRQMVKQQRIAVEKKQKALKAPHTQYNRDVDSEAKKLTESMDEIEEGLSAKEKAYNEERERIAHERQMAEHQRIESRVNQLRELGFTWDGNAEIYDFTDGLGLGRYTVLFEHVKDLSDEEWAPVYSTAQRVYKTEQDRLADIQRLKDEENARIENERKLEQERLAEQQRQLEEQQAEMKRQQEQLEADRKKLQEEKDQILLKARVDRLIAAGFVQDGKYYNHLNMAIIREGLIPSFTDEKFEEIINDAANRVTEEAERLKAEALAAKEKAKADKERQKLLKPDIKQLEAFLYSAQITGKHPKALNLPESQEVYDAFFNGFRQLVTEGLKSVAAL